MRILQIVCLSLILAGCAGVPQTSSRSETPDEPLAVQFAGFAYMGDEQAGQDNYPLTFAIDQTKENSLLLIENSIRSQFSTLKPRYLKLTSSFGNLDKGEGVAMALVLDRELVSVEQIGDNHKLLVEMGFQVLFFDFKEMTIIGSHPITLQYNDILKRPPTEKEKTAIVKGALTGDFAGMDFNKHIGQVFADVLSHYRIRKKHGNFLQVRTVTVADRALTDLPGHLQYKRNAQNYLARSLAKYLNLNQGVSVLPYTKGYAIGNRMSARYANGEVFNLIVPEPDYVIDMTLRGFKKKINEKTKNAESYLYGAYFHFVASEPETKKIYLDANFVKASFRVVPGIQHNVEDWPVYDDTILAFFNGFTRELSNPTRAWAKKYAGDAAVVKQLRNFGEKVELCR